VVDVGTVAQEYVGQRPHVLVLAVGLADDDGVAVQDGDDGAGEFSEEEIRR
jgi:hypothetical protein